VRLGLDALLVRYAPAPLARAVMVGTSDDWGSETERAATGARLGVSFVAFVDARDLSTCRVAELRRLLTEARADTVLLRSTLDDATYAAVVRTAVTAECRVLSATRRLDLPGLRPTVVWRRGRPMIELRAVSMRWQQLVLKRMLDVAGAALLLVVLAPVIAAVTLAVRVAGPGPVLYGQRRLGRYGRSFRCYKFRSMFTDAEQRLRDDPALFAEYLRNDYKLPDGSDPRITPVGRFLRRTSLDELPQLWNVLKGDMSLVGPRPIVPEEIRHYEQDGAMLLLLKPGLTGLWQVSGRSNLAYPARAGLELEYVERWKLSHDIAILLRTVPAVLAQRGAH
jgi:exopolysaccharide biosynthesis polyprenyl glycosylphosphotransferase